MAKYQVEVIETLSRVVEVEADNYDEAEDEVTKMYDNEEIVLDWQDLVSTEYKQYPSPKLDNDFNLDLKYSKENETLSVIDDKFKNSVNSCKDYEELFNTIKNVIDDMYHKQRSNAIKIAKQYKKMQEEKKNEEMER